MISYILGIVFIVLGFLVVKYPKLISGYNTLPREEQEKVDVNGLTRMIRSVSIGMGLVMIIGSYILDITGNISLLDFMMLATIFGGVLIIILAQRKFTKNTKPSKINRYGSWIVLIVVFAVIGFITYNAVSDKVIVHNDHVEITGSYGLVIPIQSIDKIEYWDYLPEITMRTNGISFWKYHKGNFRSKEMGKVKLFLHSEAGPYLVIYSQGNYPVIINRNTPEELYRLFNELNQRVDL